MKPCLQRFHAPIQPCWTLHLTLFGLILFPAFVTLRCAGCEPTRKSTDSTVREVHRLAKDASALYQVSEDDPPFLIMHGSEAPGVPVEQSERLHEALEKAGVGSEPVIVKGG